MVCGAGISWNINENISLDTGYTYTDAGSAENRIVARNGINTATGYTNTDVKLHLLYAGSGIIFNPFSVSAVILQRRKYRMKYSVISRR